VKAGKKAEHRANGREVRPEQMPTQYHLTVLAAVRYKAQYTAVRCEMKRLKVDEDIRPMSEFRTGMAAYLKQVRDTKRPLIITQHGKGVAVLLDAGEYEAMQERIELLQDIQTSISQLEGGQGIEHGDAKASVLKRIGK
jgi:prevent-host-death family protein